MYTYILSMMVVCCAYYTSPTYSVEKQNTEQNKNKTTTYVKGAASLGAVVGGWGFFAAGSTRKTGKPRFPRIQPHGRKALATFLVSNTVLQGLNYFNVSKKDKE
jgi:hypothetical protein